MNKINRLQDGRLAWASGPPDGSRRRRPRSGGRGTCFRQVPGGPKQPTVPGIPVQITKKDNILAQRLAPVQNFGQPQRVALLRPVGGDHRGERGLDGHTAMIQKLATDNFDLADGLAPQDGRAPLDDAAIAIAVLWRRSR